MRGGVEVEHHLLGRRLEGGDEHIQQNPVDRPRAGRLGAVLEAAQRRRAGQRRIAPGRRLKRGVMAQRRVVVEIFIAQRDPEHPLAQHVDQPVLHLAPLAPVDQRPRNRRRQPQPAVRLAQQQSPAVARHLAAVERRLDTALTTGWKLNRLRGTIRHRQILAFDPL